MIRTLQCPSCGGPLKWEAGMGPTVTCEFCHNTLVVSEAIPNREAAAAPGGGGGVPPDVADLVGRGRKIEAIKRIRQLYGLGLKEAVTIHDALAAGQPVALPPRLPGEGGAPAKPAPLPPDDPEILALLRQGEKIEAVRRYRERTGLGLKESKEAVEAAEAKLGLARPRRSGGVGCLMPAVAGVGVIVSIGFFLWGR
ncbi:MAG: hypothetical protein KA419_11035 [Acidobacteria bacterium]|nr:hypothetical protein [Acidobacteriota bacterium]